MTVQAETIRLRTTREGEILDITENTQTIAKRGLVENGVAFLFVPRSTVALPTIEYEPGLIFDFPRTLETLAPKTATYEHEKHWHDGNGHSHVRAALIGPDLFVPFQKRKLTLGTWQQIVFIELDIKPRDRTVLVQLIGD